MTHLLCSGNVPQTLNSIYRDETRNGMHMTGLQTKLGSAGPKMYAICHYKLKPEHTALITWCYVA